MRKRDIKEGRWVRIRYDDVGVRDAIVVENHSDSKFIKIFEPFNGTDTIESNQVVCMGPRIENVPVF